MFTTFALIFLTFFVRRAAVVHCISDLQRLTC